MLISLGRGCCTGSSCGKGNPGSRRGFKAVKIRFHHADVRDDIKVVEAVRAAVGDKLEIMVDANQGWRMPHDIEKPWDLKKRCR